MRLTAGHMAPVVLMPHEALALVAEVERLRVERAEWARLLVEAKKKGARSAVAERAAERAAVVAWLYRQHYDAIAEHIERGEHRRKEMK